MEYHSAYLSETSIINAICLADEESKNVRMIVDKPFCSDLFLIKHSDAMMKTDRGIIVSLIHFSLFLHNSKS